jgi:hypothetical protein
MPTAPIAIIPFPSAATAGTAPPEILSVPGAGDPPVAPDSVIVTAGGGGLTADSFEFVFTDNVRPERSGTYSFIGTLPNGNPVWARLVAPAPVGIVEGAIAGVGALFWQIGEFEFYWQLVDSTNWEDTNISVDTWMVIGASDGVRETHPQPWTVDNWNSPYEEGPASAILFAPTGPPAPAVIIF